jgi:hypothetical protein
MKKTSIIVIGIFLFSIIAGIYFTGNTSAEDAGNNLTFDEGKKYVYLFENPGNDRYFAVYVTNETPDFWKGVTVDVYEDSVQNVAFKVYKHNMSIYLSGIIELEEMLDDNVSYSKLDSPTSFGSLIFCLPVIYNTHIYNFSFNDLKENGSTVDLWGGEELNLILENIQDYQGYTAFKLTVDFATMQGVYYIGKIQPYMVIGWDVLSQGQSFTSISLKSVEEKMFTEEEHASFLDYARNPPEITDDEENNETENEDEKDNSIPGFEIILLILTTIIAIIWKKHRKKQ